MDHTSAKILNSIRAIIYSGNKSILKDDDLIESELYDYLIKELPHKYVFQLENVDINYPTSRLFSYIHKNKYFLGYLANQLGLQMGLFAQKDGENTNYLFGKLPPNNNSPELDPSFYLPALYKNSHTNDIEIEPAFHYNLILKIFHYFRSDKKWNEQAFNVILNSYYNKPSKEEDEHSKRQIFYKNQIIYLPSGEIDIFCLSYIFKSIEHEVISSANKNLFDNLLDNSIKTISSWLSEDDIKFKIRLDNNKEEYSFYNNESYTLCEWLHNFGFIETELEDIKLKNGFMLSEKGKSFNEFIKFLNNNEESECIFSNTFNQFLLLDNKGNKTKGLTFNEVEKNIVGDNKNREDYFFLSSVCQIIKSIIKNNIKTNFEDTCYFPIIPHTILRYSRRGFQKSDTSSRGWLVFPVEKKIEESVEINSVCFLGTIQDSFNDGTPFVSMFEEKYYAKYIDEFSTRISDIKNLVTLLADYQFKGFGKHAQIRSQNERKEINLKKMQLPYLCSLMINTYAVKNITHSGKPILYDENNSEITDNKKILNLAKYQIEFISEFIKERLLDNRKFKDNRFKQILSDIEHLKSLNDKVEIISKRDAFRDNERSNDIFYKFIEYLDIPNVMKPKFKYKYLDVHVGKNYKDELKYNPIWRKNIKEVSLYCRENIIVFGGKADENENDYLINTLEKITNESPLKIDAIKNLISDNIIDFADFYILIKSSNNYLSSYNVISECEILKTIENYSFDQYLDHLNIHSEIEVENFKKNLDSHNQFIVLITKTANHDGDN